MRETKVFQSELLVATMKICLLFIASVLLAAYAQQFSEFTTYYTDDSQCRQESLVGAIAVSRS